MEKHKLRKLGHGMNVLLFLVSNYCSYLILSAEVENLLKIQSKMNHYFYYRCSGKW